MSPKGGKREGAGRKPIQGKRLRKGTVSLADKDWEYLSAVGNGNISAGIRFLINSRPGK